VEVEVNEGKKKKKTEKTTKSGKTIRPHKRNLSGTRKINKISKR